jgi:hypothetical protein
VQCERLCEGREILVRRNVDAQRLEVRAQDRLEERVLAGEVGVETLLAGPFGSGDALDAGSRHARPGELGGRCLHDPVAHVHWDIVACREGLGGCRRPARAEQGLRDPAG